VSTRQPERLKVDGRVERTTQTRRKILEATRDLILAANSDPTAREIAGHAEITTRTLFRHFPDMDSLNRSFIHDAEERAFVVMDEPFPESTAIDNWHSRMKFVIERRVRVYESLLPLYISAMWGRYRAAMPEAELRSGIKRRRRRLEEVLPVKIIHDRLLFESIDGVLSIDYWISLRRDQQLSPRKAAQVLQRAIDLLTADDRDK